MNDMSKDEIRAEVKKYLKDKTVDDACQILDDEKSFANMLSLLITIITVLINLILSYISFYLI